MPEAAALDALISVHDVMPGTLAEVAAILALLAEHGVPPVPLLVVPGLAWTPAQLTTLKRWQDAGHELVGHGWGHRAEHIRGLRHRLHSLLLSRDAAEHLALDAGGIAELLRRCHAWFPAHGLAAPRRYVPPAWALGAIPRAALRDLPFDGYEVLSGDLDARSGRLRRLPLAGFEADTAARAVSLRAWNAANRAAARRLAAPLRIAIHPHDPDLRLGGDLRALIAASGRSFAAAA